jgi:hypothetical protein
MISIRYRVGTAIPQIEIPERIHGAGIPFDENRLGHITHQAGLYPLESLIHIYPPTPNDTADGRGGGLEVYKYRTINNTAFAEVCFDATGKTPFDSLSLALQSLQNYIALCEIGCINKPDIVFGHTHKRVARIAQSVGFSRHDELAKALELPVEEEFPTISVEYQCLKEKVFSDRVCKLQRRLLNLAGA